MYSAYCKKITFQPFMTVIACKIILSTASLLGHGFTALYLHGQPRSENKASCPNTNLFNLLGKNVHHVTKASLFQFDLQHLHQQNITVPKTVTPWALTCRTLFSCCKCSIFFCSFKTSSSDVLRVSDESFIILRAKHWQNCFYMCIFSGGYKTLSEILKNKQKN